ncbi:hypothetical protein EDD86DRAFT_250312 [Gorgonomyces haynaldii]|nr:hypothetical protein EDD86DRAFT_250312 [Gorgonomyces haynaldii]
MLTDTASIVSLSIHLGILILLFLIMLLGAFIGFKRLRGLTWAMFFIQLYGTCYSIQQCTETMIQVHQQLYSPDYPPDYDVYFGFGMFSSVLLVITLGISASCAYRGSTIVKLLLRRIRPLQ